ncbi:signal peptidase I [Paenibacillus sp. GCM10023252]|uniref:signal peptidase I n=1 Tax=Paenibacillus sp. GCM10023252 TaxID=3252649 RepID=UPI00361A90F1
MDNHQRGEETSSEVLNNQQHDSVHTDSLNVQPSQPGRGGNRAYKEIVEWIKALTIAIVFVFVIRMFLFSPFIVEGPSMQPNFETGEHIIVNKILYDIRDPKRGEVVVFHVPEENREFIKRVIGIPGDKIKVEGDDVYINDKKIDEPYLKDAIKAAHDAGELYNIGPGFPNNENQDAVVPEGTIFAMGDNRGDSRDSRMIGYVNDKEVIGRADVIFWPLNKLKLIKHG